MLRRTTLVFSTILAVLLTGAQGAQAHGGSFTPGAPGVGDPYFPLDGNGGYDVRHYDLGIAYTPSTDVLAGTATITARATQNLSAFNLDFEGLTIRSLTVDGTTAAYKRNGGELTVIPRSGLSEGTNFEVEVRYDGIPEMIQEPNFGPVGVFPTDDGMLITGRRRVAAAWFPVNDHPIDKASYTIAVTVPEGLEAVSNGVLAKTTTREGWTTWTWDAPEPMASYLVTASVGEFRINSYTADGIKYWDAVDQGLYGPDNVHGGERMAFSGDGGEPSWKRLTRTIDVSAAGATLAFAAYRNIEPNSDFFAVEAHTPGQDDWTTLPDANGHTSTNPGFLCFYEASQHPFTSHYVTAENRTCASPTGTTGAWNGATGVSAGWEDWSVDLGDYAGGQVEVSLTYLKNSWMPLPGAAIDDVVVSTGQGSTGFEADADPLDGWTPTGAPAGSAANASEWTTGTIEDLPPAQGDIIDASFARQPEILGFLSEQFGKYPFTAGGGIVDDMVGPSYPPVETQTRPIYPEDYFFNPESDARLLVHEIAHQWFGDSLAVAQWKDIWLSEGFACYADWLWSEHEGLATPQGFFDHYYVGIPPDDGFWQFPIGDPGPVQLFDSPICTRGAMTLQALRIEVGDTAFFTILRTWASSQEGGNVSTAQFIAHAEKISGKQLDALFGAWLSAGKPAANSPGIAPGLASARADGARVSRWVPRPR